MLRSVGGRIVRGVGPQIAANLRNGIVAGELVAGERLIEAGLAEKYGVSRGPIRDAFKILQAEGLVEERRQGVVVAGIGPSDIDELYSLRGSLEGLALSRFMQAGDPARLEQLGNALSRMKEAVVARDLEAFGGADIEFHNALCAISGHKRLTDVWNQYKESMMALLRQTIFVENHDLHASYSKHMVLFKLIEGGREDEAGKELALHLERSRQHMVRLWKQSERGKAVTALPIL